MTQVRSRNSGRLASAFFRRLFQIAEQFCGQEFLSQFHHFKNQRDHYLQEWWTEEVAADGDQVFREVDYEYLITALRDELQSDPVPSYEAQFSIAEVCLQFGEYYKTDLLLTHLEREIHSDDTKRQARLWMIRGYLKGQLNDWENSRTYFEDALELLRKIQDKHGVAYAYNNLGILASEQWDTKQGVDYFTRAREILGEDGGDMAQNVNMNLAVIQGIRGESSDAIEVFDSLFDDLGEDDHRTRINILINKGIAAKDAGDFELAKSVFQQAYDEARTLPDQRLIGLSALGLADVFIREHKFEDGKTSAIEAFKVFSQLHDRMSLADVYREFGMLHREQEMYELAESQFQISIRMNREFGNLLNLVESYYEYSVLMKYLNKTAEQREFLNKALSYCREMQAPRRVERLQLELDSIV